MKIKRLKITEKCKQDRFEMNKNRKIKANVKYLSKRGKQNAEFNILLNRTNESNDGLFPIKITQREVT